MLRMSRVQENEVVEPVEWTHYIMRSGMEQHAKFEETLEFYCDSERHAQVRFVGSNRETFDVPKCIVSASMSFAANVHRCHMFINSIDNLRQCRQCEQFRSDVNEFYPQCVPCHLHRWSAGARCASCVYEDTEFKDVFHRLPCGHVMHRCCVTKLKRPKCPLCSATITEMDISTNANEHHTEGGAWQQWESESD